MKEVGHLRQKSPGHTPLETVQSRPCKSTNKMYFDTYKNVFQQILYKWRIECFSVLIKYKTIKPCILLIWYRYLIKNGIVPLLLKRFQMRIV